MSSRPNVQIWADPDSADPTYLIDLGNFELSHVRGEIGTVSIDYPRDGQDFDVLERVTRPGVELEVAIRTDGTAASEERAILLTGKGDRSVPGAIFTFTGKSLAYLLEAAKTLPQAGAENGDTVFSGNAGEIAVALMEAAQAEGLLLDITWDFTDTRDSNGEPWALQVSSVTWSPGRDYVSIFIEMETDLRLAEWQVTSGRVLRLFNPGTRGVDRTLPPASEQVVLEWGRDIKDAPATEDNTNAGTRVFAVGADGLYAIEVNEAAEVRRGRAIMVYKDFNDVTDQATLTALAQAEAELVGNGEHEYSHELTLAPDGPVPGVDFGLSDWVLRVVRGETERLQVAQYVLKRDDGNVTATVALGDLIEEHEVQTRRMIERLSNGSGVVGTSTPPPDIDDGKAPAAPTGLTASSTPYKIGGDTVVVVQLGWAPVTENEDGTPATDVATYQVQYRQQSGSTTYPWYAAGEPAAAFLEFGSLRPSVTYEMRVLARDKFGNLSDWSELIEHTTQGDETPPPQMAAPEVSIQLGGQALIEVTELDVDGLAMPADYDGWQLHRSLADAFTPTDDTLVTEHPPGTKQSVWTARGATDYGVTQFFRVVAFDRDRNYSIPSDVAQATPTALGFADLPYKDVGNLAEDGSFEDPSGRAINAARSNAAWSFVEAVAPDAAEHGGWYARGDGAAGSGQRELLLSPQLPAIPGQQHAFRIAARRGATANGSLVIKLRYYLQDGTTTGLQGTFPAGDFVAGTWTEKEIAYYEVPAGAFQMDVLVLLDTNVTTGAWDVDRVEVREALGTLLIQDAAITNAKVFSLDVAKLTTGELKAAIALLGEISTAQAPNARITLNWEGFRKYDSANVARVEITEDETYIDGKLVTGRFGESRVEIGNSAEGRDNIATYDELGRLTTLLGQIYDANTGAPTNNGILVQRGVSLDDDVFKVYGSGNDAGKLYYSGEYASLRAATSITNESDGGFLSLPRNDRFDDGGLPLSPTFGRRFLNGGSSYYSVNSSGTHVFFQDLDGDAIGENIGEFNSNGMVASRLRGYSKWLGAAVLSVQNGDDILFYWNNGLKIGIAPEIGESTFVKNFVIDHPTDPSRLLVHACTESPQAGVEYWGEAEIVDHAAVVELPPYFEALCAEESRQVQVSIMLPDGPVDTPPLPAPPGPTQQPSAPWPLPPTPGVPEWGQIHHVAASRPKAGRFRIACGGPDGTRVAWLVKAVRKDVPPLDSEPLRSEVEVRGDGPYTYITPRSS